MALRLTAACLLLASLSAAALELPPFSLTDDVVPRRYSIELTIDPGRATFEGSARIDVELLRPTSVVWLNATGLVITGATAQIAGRTLPVRTSVVDPDFLAIELGSRVPSGHVVLTLKYRAPLADKSVIGPYRLKFEDRWYVYTTFTPNGARSAFPCFDQPRFKTPWELSIRIPRAQKAFANSPAVRETDEPGGMKLVEFAPTTPLPSEVVAFAVGPIDAYADQPCGQTRIPVRVLTPSGHAGDGEDAACATPGLLARLEDYTGIPYPYDKLDHIAVPMLPFGATENPGLITYRMRMLLFPPGKGTQAQERSLRGMEAHEMAHQWFGDMVTQAGWEDVWLSEGFATWLSAKILDQDQPPARRRLNAISARERIMEVDSSAKTRPVRVVMKDREAMKDVYSRFVYEKGAAVLLMLEGWLGEDSVRTALRKYLIDHRFASATTGDLAGELRLVAQIDPSDVMHDFLDQADVPVVHAEVRCEPGTLPQIVLEQTNPVARWDVPVCWKTDSRSGCTVIDTRRRVELPPGAACPAWVYPNSNGTGYYRTEWSADQITSLADQALKTLTPPERLTLVNDLNFARTRGKPASQNVESILKMLSTDPEPEIAQAAAKALKDAAR